MKTVLDVIATIESLEWHVETLVRFVALTTPYITPS